MRLVQKTLHYICRSNEEVGMWTERIISDIVKVKFNTSRKYIGLDNCPSHLKKDISHTLHGLLYGLRIEEHYGHKNNYYDFKTQTNGCVSVKTNMNGSKICPQTIGQTTLAKFSETTGYKLQTSDDYKRLVLTDTQRILDMYLGYLFCCDHMLSFKYDKGVVYHFEKTGRERIEMTGDNQFLYTKTLDTWNNSMSLSVKYGESVLPLAEFQVHSTRNCIKCRFNLDTLILLIERGMIKNVSVYKHNLRYKYNIRVDKNYNSDDQCTDSERSETE